VAARLVAEQGLSLARWAAALRPVRAYLLAPLAEILATDGLDVAGRRTIVDLYASYADGVPDAFTPLEKAAAGESSPASDPDLHLARLRHQANAAVALAALGRWESAGLLLRQAQDPTVRSYVIDRLGPGGATPDALIARLDQTGDASVRRAALLALGEFGEDRLPLQERERLAGPVLKLYRDDPDAGVHGDAGWLLRQWGQHARLADQDRAPPLERQHGSRHWYETTEGQTMVIVPPGEVPRGPGENRSKIRVEHGFALAAREVTVTEFRRFRSDYSRRGEFARTDDCPAHEVSWYDAAAYCNWLSARAGIPSDEWGYSPNEKGQYAPGMRIAPDFVRRSGYRLPTVLEWEYACRAGSVTRWSFGEAEDLLPKYAWGQVNSLSRLHPVGTLRPNDLGLFDMYGNAWEWCQDREETAAADRPASPDGVVTDGGHRLARGGAFGHGTLSMQSSNDVPIRPSERGGDLGFRPARTFR
jgi:formylglycine-generating enzyme required for sulfatase activity